MAELLGYDLLGPRGRRFGLGRMEGKSQESQEAWHRLRKKNLDVV